MGLELYEKLKLTKNDTQLENILGIVTKVYYDKQDFRMALIYYKRSLAIADENDSPSLVSLLFNISQTHFQMNNVKYGVEYLRQCIEIQETLVDNENDEDLIAYKQILSFMQLLSGAKRRKHRPKYKRLFHKRHYRPLKKKKYVLKIPAEYSYFIEQFCEQSESLRNQQN
jgi:tetratricopeptide (TPR) repeat protein